MLKSLKFSNVSIAYNLLQTFLSSCSLLMDLYMDDFKGGNKFTFVDLLQCVPSIRTFGISSFYMKYLGAGGMPEKLPTSLVYLKYLYVDLRLTKHDDISFAFCLMRSSPNLEEISFRIRNKKSNTDSDSVTNSYSNNDSDLNANSYSDANVDLDANSD
nr:hypothetical protein [Tanacetum cinerariifolium]